MTRTEVGCDKDTLVEDITSTLYHLFLPTFFDSAKIQLIGITSLD